MRCSLTWEPPSFCSMPWMVGPEALLMRQQARLSMRGNRLYVKSCGGQHGQAVSTSRCVAEDAQASQAAAQPCCTSHAHRQSIGGIQAVVNVHAHLWQCAIIPNVYRDVQACSASTKQTTQSPPHQVGLCMATSEVTDLPNELLLYHLRPGYCPGTAFESYRRVRRLRAIREEVR